MRTTVMLALAAGALVVGACTPQVSVQNDVPAMGDAGSGISVSGTGVVLGTPDTMEISVGVSVRRASVRRAVEDAAVLADDLVRTLHDKGIAEEDVQTTNYSISPEYDYSDDRPRIIGYRVDNSLTAKIRDVPGAGDVIDAIAGLGSDEIQVSGVWFSIEDDDELVKAARAAAWNDAETKAKELANLAGVELGAAVTISESFSTANPVPVSRDFDEMAADAAQATPIAAGQESVRVELQVRFALNR